MLEVSSQEHEEYDASLLSTNLLRPIEPIEPYDMLTSF
jgi:hypothetical protein